MKRIMVIIACAGLAAAAAASTIEITNSTGGWDLMTVYVSPYGSSSWGQDRLGDSTLTDGESVAVEVPAGIYSIRVIDEDGDTYTRLNTPVMGDLEWAVTLDDLDGSSGYSTGGG